MERVSMDSHQSLPIDEEARVKIKYQNLLQDYLELQKEFVSTKKRVQTAKLKRENLFTEVRFLRQRHRHLLKLQSPKGKAEFVQQQNSDIGNQLLANERDYNVNEDVLKYPSPVMVMTPISNDKQEPKRKENNVGEPLRVGKKPKNCLINDKRVGKKKISLQDQVALKV
ncbi:ribosomal RNA small subunit methyltransferase G [Fagus crenata]